MVEADLQQEGAIAAGGVEGTPQGAPQASAQGGPLAGGPLQTYALRVGYKGAAFSGYAKQPGQLTVQGELEHALGLVLRQPVETTCAGRTDTGVHARGQVVSFNVPAASMQGRELHRVRRSLNALTHDDIVVYDVAPRAQGFSARFDAVSREYRYFIATGEVPPLFMRDFSWYVPGVLDVHAMQHAARALIGEHDFKSFCKAVSAEGKPTHRFVSEVSLSQQQIMGEDMLVVKVVGNAFLHSMVRSIVGSLVMVGRGQRSVDWIAEALAACDRQAAGECAPAQGLVFWDVRYDGAKLYELAGGAAGAALAGGAAGDAGVARAMGDAASAPGAADAAGATASACSSASREGLQHA